MDGCELAAVRDLRRSFFVDPVRNGHRRPLRKLSAGGGDAGVRRCFYRTNNDEKENAVFLQATESGPSEFGFLNSGATFSTPCLDVHQGMKDRSRCSLPRRWRR